MMRSTACGCAATCALLERRDVIVVSSVSCIYGLGEPDDFAQMVISLRQGAEWDRDELHAPSGGEPLRAERCGL